MFYTLRLTIINPERQYPKVWTYFRNSFKAFTYHHSQDNISELKGMQYIVQSHGDEKYYIFLSPNKDFLNQIKQALEILVDKAEKYHHDKLKHCFKYGMIVDKSE